MTESDVRRQGRPIRRTPIGASPGTLIADPSASRSSLTLTLISPDEHVTMGDASLQDVIDNRGRWPILWLDCVGLGDVEMIASIGSVFNLHPLALEDTVNTGQRPKVDFFDDHAFVVVSMIDDARAGRYEQIAVFFGEGFVVTFQERAGDPFDPVRKRIQSPTSHRIRVKGSDYLAYALIDAIVDSYFPILETAADTIDRLEDQVMTSPERHQSRQLHELKRGTMVLKRALWPLRDAVAGLIRAEVPFIQSDTKVFLNDTLDHCVRLMDIVETHRDMLSGLLDMHLSLSQARINDVISFLTIISAIFIPLTFLAGIWGMNFDPGASPWNMPELLTYYGYPIALGLMAVIAVSLVLYFKHRKWL